MGGENDLGPLLHGILDGRHGAGDPGVLGDIPLVVLGDVEVDPDEDLLPLQILDLVDIANRHGISP